MDVAGWIKRFFFKICSKIEDRLAAYIASGIIIVVLVICIVFWEWIKTKHSLEVYGWLWVLISVVILFLVVFFFRSMLNDRGRLKNPRDIVSAINAWFADGDHQMYPVNLGIPHSFSTLEKELYLKQGSSLKYLPMCALTHGYVFEMGHKTFTLKKLTRDNDPREVFEKYYGRLNQGEKEFVLTCSDIDNELGWPKGAVKSYLLTIRTAVNKKFDYDVEDIGGNQVRIKRKN